ncbi:MAG: minichromosome maintenance protein MCM [Thermosphaera aggregans]|jgi:replicative DNA helicase Mcm|uniref:minichromosome maintenance protein MCM n=1 Tax=Thermosphaera aggregans TaxID=54254 RepID=UPI003C096081
MEVQSTRDKELDPLLEFRRFLERFQTRDGVAKYQERIRHMVYMNQRSLVIDFDDIIMFNRELARFTSENPDKGLEIASQAIMEIMRKSYPEYAQTVEKFYPRFRNPPRIFRIRELNSEYIGKLVALEGIVTRVSRVEARIVKAFYRHVDSETGELHEFFYPKEGEMGERLERPPYCLNCQRPVRLELVPEKSKFIDWQKIVVQEKPEEIPPGQMPRSVEVILTGDLIDVARPGDRVIVTGVLRVAPIASLQKPVGLKPLFSFYVDANHVDVQQKILEEIEITREDEEKIKELARDPWIREKIIASIAPGIYGHWDVKEAIALLLFGGVPKVMEDGTRIRGDMHVLLVGDPGTAKSQLLQYTSRIAPRGLYTSGKGSTAAGLTATVLREKTTGEYYLEAGALVIADGGVACIDEIDKMREEDRSAIHEALEQQTVSIAKAGIVARLNARASVLAAGNPKFGRYDLTQPVSKNIDLPPTILSRFDLIFVIQDIPNKERDRLLAKHILEVHSDIEKARQHIDPQLLKKYVSYARRYIRPQLTLEAKKLLEDFYVSMRMASLPTEAGKPTAIAITPRQLEALIRLTEAHAKMALKQKATEEDAQEAIRLTLNTLVKVGYDIESKTIDIDILETGISAARREKIKALKSFMDQLLDEVGEIERNELIKKAVEKGFDRELVLEQIQKLIQSGEYYMPRPGKLSRVK